MIRPAEALASPSWRPDRAAELVAKYGLAAFILCLPLEFTSLWLHQQLSRFVLIVAALAFAYLVLVRRRRIALPHSASAWLLGLYVAASLTSWLISRAPGSASSLGPILLYPVAGLLIANLVTSEADHRRAWIALLASGLGVALLGIVIFFAHLAIWTPNAAVAARLNITFGDPNITARFLSICACAAILMFAARKGPAGLPVATALGCAGVLPLTLSRSGLALFLATVLLAIVVASNHRRAAAIGVVAVLVFALSTGVNPSTRQRAEGAVTMLVGVVTGKPAAPGSDPARVSQTRPAIDDNRTYLVAAGLKMFTDHPALGVGFGGYQHALTTDYKRFLPAGRSLDTLSHASLITVMAEQGIVGTALLIALLFALAIEAWRARRRRDEWAWWSTIPATLLIPIFLFSQFEGRFFQEPYLWLALGLMYSAHTLAARNGTVHEMEARSLRDADRRRGSVEVA
jgi:putative inorganic carbon (HCO3(-)) transporter